MTTPAIPSLSNKTPIDIRRAIDAIKRHLITNQGSLDTVATLVRQAYVAASTDPSLYVTPPAPSGLLVNGAFNSIILQWDANPATGHAYTEVWRSTTDDLGAAVCVGFSSGQTFADTPPDSSLSVTYYYWIRHINLAGAPGPYNAVAGTSGSTANDPAYVLQLLLDNLGYDQFGPGVFPVRTEDTLPSLPHTDYPQGCVIFLTSDDKLYRNTNDIWTAEVAAVDIVGTITETQIADNAISTPKLKAGAVEADNLAANSVTADNLVVNAVTAGKIAAGAIVADDGVIANAAIAAAHIINGTITNAKIANVAADKLYAASGTLAEALIGTGHIDNAMIGNFIQSTAFSPGVGGWRINKDGDAEFHNIVIYDSSGNIALASGSGVNWSSVAGTGKPANNATVGATWKSNVSNQPSDASIITSQGTAAAIASQGYFATLDQVTADNINTYIAGAAIDTAYIKNAAIKTALIDDANITTLKVKEQNIVKTAGAIIAEVNVSNTYDVWTTRNTITSSIIAGIDVSLNCYFRVRAEAGYASNIYQRFKITVGGTIYYTESHSWYNQADCMSEWYWKVLQISSSTSSRTVTINHQTYSSYSCGTACNVGGPYPSTVNSVMMCWIYQR